MIKRFDRLDIATTDLGDAAAVYAKNFGLTVSRQDSGTQATIAIGDAQIRLRSGPEVAELISSVGEGLAAVWLEADDVEQVAEALRAAGATMSPIRIEAGRRILAVAPQAANLVPLYIFDRRTN